MKTIRSVFGNYVMAVALVFGLAASSCGNQRSEEVKVKERNDGSEEVRIRERKNTDSVDVTRDRSYERDEDGNVDTRVRDKVDVERDRSGNDDDNNR